MAEQAGYDRNRGATRAKRRLMVRFGVQMPEKTGFTKDISETGLFIRTNSVLPPGRTIQVQMEFPDETFTLWAKVISRAIKPGFLGDSLSTTMVQGRPSSGFTLSSNPCASSAMTPI